MKKLSLFLALLIAAASILGACSSKNEEKKPSTGDDNKPKTDYKVAMVTDVGGVDDKSFNQSAWEGLKKYGEENNLVEKEGFNFAESNDDSDYMPHLNSLTQAGFDLIFGIGFLMEEAIKQIADENPEVNYSIVDMVVDKPNVASITFAEHEGSFLVGVVAAMQTKTNKVGFIGGVDMPLIHKFEEGFKAGVAAVDKDIEVEVTYTGAFDAPDKGKATASAMYNSNVDVIYHAAGGTGNGVFTEAKSLKEADPSREIWVIGVDRDQAEEGKTKDGDNITLTSMIKKVGVAVKDVADKGKDGNFPGGQILTYDLKSDGVGIAPTQDNLSKEILDKVEEFRQKIIDGEIEVPFERK